MAGRDPEDVARDAWRWLKDAEGYWRKTENNSADEMHAIQTMSLAAMAALTAEQASKK